MARTTACEPNSAASSVSNAGTLQGGRIDCELVGASAENGAAFVHCGDATASGQWDRQLGGDAANRFEKRGPMVARGGDVQDDQFVGALLVVASRQSGWIAGVAQIDEVHALDDALAVSVETRNDAPRQRHEALPPLARACATKLARTRAPISPDFSG